MVCCDRAPLSWTVEIPSWFCVMVCCDRAPLLLIFPHYILCNRASVFRSLPHVTWRPSYSFVTGVIHCSRAPYPLVSCERALFSCSRRTKNESVKHCLTMPAVLPGNERLLACWNRLCVICRTLKEILWGLLSEYFVDKRTASFYWWVMTLLTKSYWVVSY